MSVNDLYSKSPLQKGCYFSHNKNKQQIGKSIGSQPQFAAGNGMMIRILWKRKLLLDNKRVKLINKCTYICTMNKAKAITFIPKITAIIHKTNYAIR